MATMLQIYADDIHINGGISFFFFSDFRLFRSLSIFRFLSAYLSPPHWLFLLFSPPPPLLVASYPFLFHSSLILLMNFTFLFVKLRCSMQRIHRFAALLLTLSAKFLNYQQSSGLITRHAYKNHSHFICTQIMSYWYWEF